MQTNLRRAVIFLCHWIVWFKRFLSARKPLFRSFFPLDFLSLPPFHNYFQATSLCTLSTKKSLTTLAWKNPYYSHQPERRKRNISILNNQWWFLLSSLSYTKIKTKPTSLTFVCSPPVRCDTKSLGYSRCPKWNPFEKGSQLFHHPKGKGESNLIPKRKAAGAFCFIWEDNQNHQSPQDHSPVNDREALLLHTLLLQGDGEFRWVQPPTGKNLSPTTAHCRQD